MVEHLSVVLKKEDGSLYSIGIEKSRIVSPEKKFLLPRNNETYAIFDIPCSTEEFKKFKKMIDDARCYQSISRSPVDLCIMLEKSLGKSLTPMKPVVTRHMFLSYLAIPLVITRLIIHKRNSTMSRITEILTQPNKPCLLDYKQLKLKLSDLVMQRTKKTQRKKKEKKKKEVHGES